MQLQLVLIASLAIGAIAAPVSITTPDYEFAKRVAQGGGRLSPENANFNGPLGGSVDLHDVRLETPHDVPLDGRGSRF